MKNLSNDQLTDRKENIQKKIVIIKNKLNVCRFDPHLENELRRMTYEFSIVCTEQGRRRKIEKRKNEIINQQRMSIPRDVKEEARKIFVTLVYEEIGEDLASTIMDQAYVKAMDKINKIEEIANGIS